MKKIALTLGFVLLLVASACGPSPEALATRTATAQTATAAEWTRTYTSTLTFTSTFTFSPTLTPTFTATFTATDTPTITYTPSLTASPTFDFPKVEVNVAHAACLYGPAKPYLWKFDLSQGDKGFVGGRSALSNWLWVKFDRWPDYCWVSPYVLNITGDVNRLLYQQIRLPITNALYAAPTNVKAERDGDQVTVSWNEVWMTLDDDRGYFLDVWVCQNGNYVWVPAALPDQYHNSYTFTDEAGGCSQKSGGQLYTVEKHGYTSPADIPWPER